MKISLTTLVMMMGLFSFLQKGKGEETPKLEKRESLLAFVLLPKESFPRKDGLLESFKKFSGPGETLKITSDSEKKEEKAEDDVKVMVANIEGIGSAFIMLISKPVPNNEAEEAFEYSLSSFQDGASLDKHEAHLVVSLMDINKEKTSTEAMMAFTSLLAAVGECSSSSGIYWGDTGATHKSDFFLSVAAEYSISDRLLLWTGISRASEEGDRISLVSLGMNQLALPNLYLICSRKESQDAFEKFFSLLEYTIDRGSAIPEGDTIGSDENEKIPVRYVKCPAGGKELVWQVEF